MDEPIPEPEIFYTVNAIWTDRPMMWFDDVMDFKLDNDIYYFFVWSARLPANPAIKTIWLKHPNLVSLEIDPYKKSE